MTMTRAEASHQATPEPFAPLLGPDFKVKVRFDFSKEDLHPEIMKHFKAYEAQGLTHIDKKGVRQIFEPAYAWTDDGLSGACSGSVSHVLIPAKEFWREADEIRLVFRRKTNNVTGVPRLWMLAARHGEEECFAALSTLTVVTHDPNYITLTFRSIEKGVSSFEPMFLKILCEGEYAYFKIEADYSGTDIIVTCVRVLEIEAPKTLWRECDWFGEYS